MKISVVTINYNNKEGLLKTIISVISQTYKEFEFVVIDGLSNDGSVDILNDYKQSISRCVIEKDSGIYDAMNKGVVNSTGDYLLFLNSGDELFERNTLEKVVPLLCGEHFVTGREYMHMGESPLYVIHPPRKVDVDFLVYSSLRHQATFISREVFKKNMYDITYRLVSDWKLELEAIIFGSASYKPINLIVDKYERDGATLRNKNAGRIEKEKVLLELLPDKVHLFTQKPSFIRRVLKKIQRSVWALEAKKIKKNIQ